MEGLYANFLLWLHGFNDGKRYAELLNSAFVDDSTNDILLELEECSSSLLDTRGQFMRYWTYKHPEIDAVAFGRELFGGLKINYNARILCIEEFGKRCYRLWNDLPPAIGQTEPFFTLCYADDCLSWNDEVQTRMLYEKAFAYYL